MLESIGEIQIIENIQDKDYATSVEIFKAEDIIKVIRKANGSSSVVWEGSAEEFLLGIHWMYQFLKTDKIKELKTWRR